MSLIHHFLHLFRSQGFGEHQEGGRTQRSSSALVEGSLQQHLHIGVRKGSANTNAGFLSRLPLPATAADDTGLDSIGEIDTTGVSLVRTSDSHDHPSRTPALGLGGLASGGFPRPVSSGVFEPPRLTPEDFRDFGRHGPAVPAATSASVVLSATPRPSTTPPATPPLPSRSS